MTGEGKFSTADHLLLLREERCDGQNIWDDSNNAKRRGLVNDLGALDHCLILHSKNTGTWLSIRGTTVTGSVLAAM